MSARGLLQFRDMLGTKNGEGVGQYSPGQLLFTSINIDPKINFDGTEQVAGHLVANYHIQSYSVEFEVEVNKPGWSYYRRRLKAGRSGRLLIGGEVVGLLTYWNLDCADYPSGWPRWICKAVERALQE